MINKKEEYLGRKNPNYRHGGYCAYLMSLDQVVPLASNARQYAEIVKDKALRRRLVTAAREIIDLAGQESGATEEIVDEAERKIFNIAEK